MFMTASALCRWHRAWISGTSVACLGLSGILCGGCAPLSNNDVTSSAPPAKQQQIAKSNFGLANQKMIGESPDSTRKPTQKVAKKPTQKTEVEIAAGATGRVRITDVGNSSGTDVASNTRQPKPEVKEKTGAAAPADAKSSGRETRGPETELVADWVETLEPAADGKKASRWPQNVKPASGSRRFATKSADSSEDPFLADRTAARYVDELSNDTLPDDAAFSPTSTDAPPAPTANRRKLLADKKPAAPAPAPAAPANSPADGDRLLGGSNHERQRANVLMERAYAMYRSGYPDEALRLASVAAELEKTRQAAYRKGEERPTDFITWLQSADGGRSASPPVIRPQRPSRDLTGDAKPRSSAAGIAAAPAAARTQRQLGEILRTEGESILQPRDSSNPRPAARTNSGTELVTAETPRFSGSDNAEQRATANLPQTAASDPPATRSADAAVAASAGDGPRFDSFSVNDAPPPPPPPAESPRIKSRSSAASGPSLALSDSPPETRPSVATTGTRAAAESEAFTETEAPALIPLRTTQLTLIGIIGLLAGVAGMGGLSWWHIQERRHFAAKAGAADHRAN
jgi:hypothetical protein